MNIIGILMRKFDNDKFIEAEKWLEEHPEEEAKMERHITENELCESLKNKSASIDFVGGIKGFRITSGNPRQFNYRDVSVWFFKSIKILPATF